MTSARSAETQAGRDHPDLLVKLRMEADEKAQKLGHQLKPWSKYDSLWGTTCVACGKSAFIDCARRYYPIELEGPALKFGCLANRGLGGK